MWMGRGGLFGGGGEIPKSYSNALSSGCREKLEAIVEEHPWRNRDRFEKERERERERETETEREGPLLRDEPMSEKHYTLFMNSLPTRALS